MSTGTLITSQFTQDHAKKSFAGMITRLMPNGEAPLFGMTSMLKEESAVQTEHGFFSKTMLFPQMTLAAAVAGAGDAVFTVTSTANLLPGMLMRAASTGEIVIINNIIGTTQVAVGRGIGNVAAGAINNSVVLYQVGSAYEEASLRPVALQINPVRITNLTQIFRNSWAVSGSAAATQMLAGQTNVAESRQDCAAFHAVDIEKALFWGQRFQGTRNGQPFRTMDGLLSFVNTLAYYPSYMTAVNVFTAGGTTTYAQLEGFLDVCFNQNTDPKQGNRRVLFVGGNAKRVITNIARLATGHSVEIMPKETSYGLQYTEYRSPRGTFNIVEHPLFNSNTDWQRVAFAVDLGTFNLAYLRRTENKEFNSSGNQAQDNGVDAEGGTLTTELTCLVKNPPANSVVFNLTAAAAG
jgi:hypothetical protein